MEPICKKSTFKKLLTKLTGEGNFFVKLIKQTDGCVMGSPYQWFLPTFTFAK